MKNALMIPVHLDALYLERDRLVVEAMADFSRLPYFDGTRDVNSNIANISEEIVSQPFQNQNLYLKAGIHLHWALPDALTKGIQVINRQTTTVFPPVPNRWLVTRSRGETIEKQWIVESDYLYPEGQGSQVSSIAYPIEVKKDKHQPFRYLGRKVPLAAWSGDEAKAEYLPSLTAVGYGEPTFAAFYPNCHSVFGFHDGDYAAEIPDGLQYDIIGWYSEAQQTCLQDFLEKLINTLQQQRRKTPISNRELIKEEFKWEVTLNADQEFPDPLRFICYARLNFPQHETNTDISDRQAPVKVSVGNTGTEALSAYLAQQIGGDRKSIIEDQLEALHLSSRLEHRQLDMTPKCKEARHEKGFNGIAAGTMWTIHSESVGTTTANTEDAHNQAQLTLPDDMAHLLNELNLSQQKYDCTLHEIESMRRQIFADWYKYMLSAYPPEGSKDQYPHIDEVKHYIEVKGIAPLQAKLSATGNLTLLGNKSGKLLSAKTEVKDSSVTSIASLLAENINKLLQAITGENIKQCDLKVSDIRDWSAFILQFNKSNEEPIVRIKRLIPDLESKLQKFDENNIDKTKLEDIKAEIINALNPILRKREFYQETVFGKLTLSAEAELLKKKQPNLTEEEWVRFNRQLLEASFPQLILKVLHPYILRQISSPRYWQPKEPVLLMTGEAVKPTPRHGQDGRLRENGLLECQILKDIATPICKDSLPAIRQKIDEIEKSLKVEHIAFSNWEEQPWYPFLLEWEVEVFPIREGSNHITHNTNYDAEFITDNYVLKENEPDLSLKSGKGAIVKVANVYSGRSILTPHSGIKLKEQLEAYLRKQILPQYYEAKDIPKDQQSDHYLSKSDNCQSLKKWYEEAHAAELDTPEKKAKDPIYTAICADEKLHEMEWNSLAKSVNCLSQSLSGFNEALLMHKQTLQLPVAEPLAFTEYKRFTDEVCDIVQQSIRSAPEPLDDFNPIRSGAMKILRLRLVDTFGQVKDLDISQIITTEQMTTPGSPYLVSLAPRLVQPARLNFRWLSAIEGEQEMNSHPATTPICGWILPNNLDNSLAIYDNQGKALGSINSGNQTAQWESAPGRDIPLAIVDIENEHLKKLVKHILSMKNGVVDTPQPPPTAANPPLTPPRRGARRGEKGESVSFLSNFITVLDNGLENIDPENFAQHQSLALLMGRPIAVVRASLDLELQGLPAINQDWDVFWRDLRRNTRDTDDFEQVKIPIRLGEYKQFNDGLLGYWLEEGDKLREAFYAPQSDSDDVNDPQIKFHSSDNPWHIDLNVEDPPQMFTMLIDPRGKVHATCGILPTKAIDIPTEQYRQALEKIEITFLSTPVLTDLTDLRDINGLSNPTNQDKKINLPLAEEEGYEWSWLEKEKGEWLEVSHGGIGQANPKATFSGKQVIREGWLKLTSKKKSPE